jgi:hypothetical protein
MVPRRALNVLLHMTAIAIWVTTMNTNVARSDLASCRTHRVRAKFFRRVHRLWCTVLHKHIMPRTVNFFNPSLQLVNNVKSEQSTRIMSDFRCIAWENRSTSGFFHRSLVHWHSLGRGERSVKPVVTGNHSIVRVESATRISLHHASVSIPPFAMPIPPGPNGGIDTKPEE